MDRNFTVSVDHQKITCRAGSKNIYVDYHGTLVGWIYWVFNWADWVKVNDQMLYVDRHSLVTTIFKVPEATRLVWEDSFLSSDTTEKQFYEKVFGKVFEVKENGPVVKIDSLNDWIDSQIRAAQSPERVAEKLAENLPLYLHCFKEDFRSYFLQELMLPQPPENLELEGRIEVLKKAIAVLKYFDFSEEVSQTKKYFDDPVFAPVCDHDEVKKMKCRYAAIFIEEAINAVVQPNLTFGVSIVSLPGLTSRMKAFGEESRNIFLKLLSE